jgi:hypothetical protein
MSTQTGPGSNPHRQPLTTNGTSRDLGWGKGQGCERLRRDELYTGRVCLAEKAGKLEFREVKSSAWSHTAVKLCVLLHTGEPPKLFHL